MSARSRGRAPRLGPSREVLGGALMLGVGLTLFGGLFLAAGLFGAPTKLDPATLCPVEAPVALRVALLVDRTDPYDPAQQRIVAHAIARLQDGLPQSGRLTVHLVGADPAAAVAPALDLCNPGTGAAADPWFANPRRVQAKFDRHFAAPIDALVADLMRAARADRSPLLEAISLLAATLDPATPTRVVLISDLLQHTDALSLYRGRPPVAGVLATPLGTQLADGRLAGVAFDLVALDNPRAVRRQGPALLAFWRDLLTAAGGLVRDDRAAPPPSPAS